LKGRARWGDSGAL